MPLDIIGSYAASSSNGAVARTARSQDTSPSATTGSAASSFRSKGEPAETKVSSQGGLAVFVSPFIRLDVETRLAIVEIRNSQTGEVQQQYPSPRAVREYAQNLPDNSDLRSEGSEKQDEKIAPRIIGSDADKAVEAAKAQTSAAPAQADTKAAPIQSSREVAVA